MLTVAQAADRRRHIQHDLHGVGRQSLERLDQRIRHTSTNPWRRKDHAPSRVRNFSGDPLRRQSREQRHQDVPI
jgi:hypothetical protein